MFNWRAGDKAFSIPLEKLWLTLDTIEVCPELSILPAIKNKQQNSGVTNKNMQFDDFPIDLHVHC